MPKIWPILSQAFTDVFTRLGIQAVPAGQQWFLSDTLIPVTLVDSDIVLRATVAPQINIVVSNGAQVAPAAGATLADTGALVQGDFSMGVLISVDDTTSGNRISVQHRDAANAANNWVVEIYHVAAGAPLNFFYTFTERFLGSERLRIQTGLAGAAGARYQATIFRTAL